MPRLWCNGRWIDTEDFRVAASDRVLLHGLGLFETLLAIDGRPVFADRHLSRLELGCKRLGWPLESVGLAGVMRKLLHSNGLHAGRARIRLTLTAGSGSVGDLTPGKDHLLWMSASAFSDPPETIAVCVSPFPRNEHSPLAGLKCASYAENLIALDLARRVGVDEALFFNTAGDLCEAATSNVFLAKDGTVFTPALDSGCLPGIARSVVIELARSLGIPCHESRLTHDGLMEAGEVFLTSSIRGPVAVTRIGNQSFGAGDITSALRRAWDDLARREAAG